MYILEKDYGMELE